LSSSCLIRQNTETAFDYAPHRECVPAWLPQPHKEHLTAVFRLLAWDSLHNPCRIFFQSLSRAFPWRGSTWYLCLGHDRGRPRRSPGSRWTAPGREPLCRCLHSDARVPETRALPLVGVHTLAGGQSAGWGGFAGTEV